MSAPKPLVQKTPYLLVVDGESKTAKTTGTNAARAALEDLGLTVYEADAGAFFRRMTVCVLEDLGVRDMTVPHEEEFSMRQLHAGLRHVIKRDAAYEERTWPSLECVMVERYVSTIGNATEAQTAMEGWYDKITELAEKRAVDVLLVNARNPRARLKHWKAPILDLLVFCEPLEAGRRILYARGIKNPTASQLEAQAKAVAERRRLDRNREKHPFVDPLAVVECAHGVDIAKAAKTAVAKSWHLNNHLPPPATIRFDTTHINLQQTVDGIGALAQAAIAYVR